MRIVRNASDSRKVSAKYRSFIGKHLKSALHSAVPSVAAGVEARMKGNANGPQSGGGRTRQEGRGKGGGRGIRQGTDQPTRAETGDVDVGGAGERNSRARIPRGKDLGKRHEHDRFDGTGRGYVFSDQNGTVPRKASEYYMFGTHERHISVIILLLQPKRSSPKIMWDQFLTLHSFLIQERHIQINS